jgi:hypothetical protein
VYSGEKRTPDLSIQDRKKRFGSFLIVFIKMQPVTGFAGRIGNCPFRVFSPP